MFKFVRNLLIFIIGAPFIFLGLVVVALGLAGIFAVVLGGLGMDKLRHRPSPVLTPSGKITRSKRKKWRETHPITQL